MEKTPYQEIVNIIGQQLITAKKDGTKYIKILAKVAGNTDMRELFLESDQATQSGYLPEMVSQKNFVNILISYRIGQNLKLYPSKFEFAK